MSAALAAALVLAAAAVGAALLDRKSAATRHLIWTFGVLAAVAMPLAIWLAPARAASPALGAAVIALPPVLVQPRGATAFDWTFAIWAAGAAIVGLRVAHAHLAAWRIARTAIPIEDGVYRGAVDAPMTIGILRPRIVIPRDAEMVAAVVLHERAHVARHDVLVQLVAQIACAMYWWNPLAWFAAARLRVEREHACDDAVLAAGIVPSSYAAALLATVQHRVPAGAGIGDASVATRIERVLDAGAPRRAPRRWLRLACGALTCASVVMLACSAARPAGVAPASRGILSIGAPSVRGPGPFAPPAMFRDVRTAPPIDLARVADEVQRRAGTLEACYQRRLAARPDLAGTVEIHWVIDETGRVLDACITRDTVGDRDLTECVSALGEQGPFPGSAGIVDVSVPFVFATRS